MTAPDGRPEDAPAAPRRVDPVGAELARVEAALAARWPESKIVPTTARIRSLLELLGNPQATYPVIHLTGTNGKTSTARMVDALLRAFGVRVGRMTSPHLVSVTERIAVDGEAIAAEEFVRSYDELAPYLHLVDQGQDVPLVYFEVLTAMGYAAFADAPVEVAVVEVGLGGRWDATNVADGQVSVITPVEYDHTALLGGTLAEIATEKAGIIKPAATAILAAQPPEVLPVLLAQAAEVGASVARQGLEFGVADRRIGVGGQQLRLRGLAGEYDEVFLPLHGAFQAQNAACALAAVEAFFGRGGSTGRLDPELVREGFAAVRSPGRLEVVRTAPTVLLDAAHNPAGMTATAAAVGEAFGFRRLVAVVATLADKDVRGMLVALEPVVDEVVVTENRSYRRLPADELAAIAVAVFGAGRVTVELRLDDAIEAAIRLAEEGGTNHPLGGAGVLVTGSVVTAGEARTLLGAR
ncbi:MAG: bifunctional folylpolyglutamate synthase/dihydrofolate synthase [Actinobacteria bacterium]|nr:bifunctional folylpolyglutamate synthase/dihydrofolate synthase [Actinomycetota bacterium]